VINSDRDFDGDRSMHAFPTVPKPPSAKP